MEINSFNVRVYGLALRADQVLVSKESYAGRKFMKFPGGGLEKGEGLISALKREFQEELGVAIEVVSHFYTTDFFQVSAFDESQQLLSIYYRVKVPDFINLELINDQSINEQFSWVKLEELSSNELSFPVDRHVMKLLNEHCG